MRLFWMLVGPIIIGTTQVSGQTISLGTEFPGGVPSSVYTGVYSAGTSVSVLVNESNHVSYLPFCEHTARLTTYPLELYRTDTNTDITRTNGPVNRDFRLYWPPSVLAPNDSATYRCHIPSTSSVSASIYILSVVVDVDITQFQLAGEVFTNTSFEAVCCAEGYPEPMVTVNTTLDRVVKNVTNTTSDGVSTICRRVTFTARSYGKFDVACQATLAPYNCSAAPSAANTLCGATTNTTTVTKTVTANEPVCRTYPPEEGPFECNDTNKYGSVCSLTNCTDGFQPPNNTTCLGTGSWSQPLPKCLGAAKKSTSTCVWCIIAPIVAALIIIIVIITCIKCRVRRKQIRK